MVTSYITHFITFLYILACSPQPRSVFLCLSSNLDSLVVGQVGMFDERIYVEGIKTEGQRGLLARSSKAVITNSA
jgi:hypothetical protein